MDIRIIRTRTKERSTDGKLYIDNQLVCHTAEATPYRLPAGEYRIRICKSAHYHRKMPVITSITSDSHHATIARGNGIFALHDPTIIVGRYLVPGVVIHTQRYFNILFQRIRKGLERGHDIRLNITSLNEE